MTLPPSLERRDHLGFGILVQPEVCSSAREPSIVRRHAEGLLAPMYPGSRTPSPSWRRCPRATVEEKTRDRKAQSCGSRHHHTSPLPPGDLPPRGSDLGPEQEVTGNENMELFGCNLNAVGGGRFSNHTVAMALMCPPLKRDVVADFWSPATASGPPSLVVRGVAWVTPS